MATSARPRASAARHRDHPDDLRRKLALLEGDRKAYYESSQVTMRNNKDLITALRKENTTMASRLKAEKRGSNVDAGAEVKKLKHKIHEMVAKHNSLRHQCEAKENTLVDLQKALRVVEKEEAALDAASGAQKAMQKIRALENRLDKATIKAQEAQHIGRTYNMIIEKMKQDRLGFDEQATALERAIGGRKKELANLEGMCTDAEMARNHSKVTLAKLEAELASERSERRAEKLRLNSLADERRRQYDAMERRIRQAASSMEEEGGDEEVVTEETRWKILSYEDAMKEIRDATGVSDVDEVVQRFLAQGETREHLQDLQTNSKEQLAQLKEESERLTKQFEGMKYSGEARNTGNQRMLAEFEGHLADTEGKCYTARDSAVRATQVFVDLKTGIENLHEKLGRLNPVQFRAASNVQDKLTESQLRLAKLVEELEHRRSELPGGFEAESIPQVLPQHNTRIVFEDDKADAAESEEEEDLLLVSRAAMKQAAQSLVDAKTPKKRGGKKR